MSDPRRQIVIEEAKTWLDTPFVMNACLKGAGVDCGQFLIACLKAADLKVPEQVFKFSLDWHLHAREEKYLKIVESVCERTVEPLPGDIVLYRIGRVYAHSGLITEWPLIIHSDWKSHKIAYTDVSKDGFYQKRACLFFSPYGPRQQ
jgi:hypothetical protein